MPIDRYKLGWSVGGKLVLGTEPFIPNTTWDEGTGHSILDVLMTSGEFTTARTPMVQTMASIREIDDHGSVIKVLLADGVEIINGSLGFDCNRTYMQTFLSWILEKRKESFSAYIGTENFKYLKVPSCTWNSVTFSSGEGSILNASMSFMSNVKPDAINSTTQQFTSIFKDSNLIPYWQTGALLDNDILKVVSWTITINQNVTPQYLNTQDFDLPAYFRVADWEFQINVQTLVSTQEYDKIQIGVMDTLAPILMSFDESIQVNATAGFGGLDEMGHYQLSIELIGKPSSYTDDASYQQPFTITFT